MTKARAALAAAVATTLAACAGASPCLPLRPIPAPIAKTDYQACSGNDSTLTGVSAVVRYAAGSTDSIRHPDRVIAGPPTALCSPSAIAQGPAGELYVLNHAPWYSTIASREDRWMSWVTVYDSSAQGDAVPLRTLHIANRLLRRPISLGVDRAGYLHVGYGADPRADAGTIAVFAPDADGDARPIRVIIGPRNGLGRPAVVAVDRHGYLYAINSHNRTVDHAVRVFAPDAKGDAAPCRVIEGPRTQITRPSGLALDRQGRLYVGSSGSTSQSPEGGITVYAPGVTGDTAPIRRLIGGDYYGMGWPTRLLLDRHDSLYVRSPVPIAVYAPGATGATEPVRRIMRRTPGPQFARVSSPELYVLDRHDTLYAMAGDTVMVYPPGFSGTESPVRRIAGPRSGIRDVTDLALDHRGWLYLALRGPYVDSARIVVFPPGASGDVAPGRTITGPLTGLRSPTSIALDRKRRLYVANASLAGREDPIAVYPPGARGEDRPVRVLEGPATGLWEPSDIEFDSGGNLYVPARWSGQVSVFRPGASGDEAPLSTIAGPRTGLSRPLALALGPGDTLYALSAHLPEVRCDSLATWGHAAVTVYPPGASGDVEPVRSLVLTQNGRSPGRNYGLNLPRGLAVDSSGAVQIWSRGEALMYSPGAEGLAVPAHTVAETTVEGAAAAGVTVTGDGWTYQTNVPRSGKGCNQ
jgi:sugar lactone lactonase YvrE